jgi:hypothetical protein
MVEGSRNYMRISIPIACIACLGIVMIVLGDAALPLGLLALGFFPAAVAQPLWLIALIPFAILLVSAFPRSLFRRSVLFLTGATILTAGWLLIIIEVSTSIRVSIITSLPYMGIVGYWTAVSLSAILRRQK